MFEEMRVGYATADVTVSLQSISDDDLLVHHNILFFSSPHFFTNSFLFFSEVASQLGYDNLDAVTKEDMALEVK